MGMWSRRFMSKWEKWTWEPAGKKKESEAEGKQEKHRATEGKRQNAIFVNTDYLLSFKGE